MRRGNDPDFLRDGGKVLGVNLGADYVSEHEWGIKDLRRAFSCDDSGYGIERRRCTPPAKDFGLVEDGKALIYLRTYDTQTLDKMVEHYAKSELHLRGHIAAAWDAGSFCVRVHASVNASGKGDLAEIHTAFLNRDAAIWLGGGGVFANAGLVLAIISRIPPEKLAAMEESDRDHERLLAAAKATGIEEVLRAAGKQWFALSPRRENAKKKSVVFWLNPMEQQIHNSMWCTVEDLKQWAKDQGPIMKTAKKRGSR